MPLNVLGDQCFCSVCISISGIRSDGNTVPLLLLTAYEKIGTIQRRGLAWPLHKDDTLFQNGRPMGLNIYFFSITVLYCIEVN